MERKQRLDSLFLQTIAEIINQRLDRPLDFLLTVAKVDTSPDLDSIKIYYTVLPDEKKEEGLKFLIKNSSEIKRHLAGKLRSMKKMPKFKFVYEQSQRRAREIEAVLDELKDLGGGSLDR
ncbi:MAG: 30S ribosome-binding factor RbfA [Patescibacteria group bacterium]